MTAPNEVTKEIALQELTCLIRHHTDPAAFQEIRSALSAFATIALPVEPSAVVQEPDAFAVYWGIGQMRKNSVHFERKTAEEVAAQIKSNTEIRPLYTHPPDKAEPTAQPISWPQGLIEILREASDIISAIDPSDPPINIRWPIVDELDGFAYMIFEQTAAQVKPTAQPVAQWQKRAPDGDWENTKEQDAKYWVAISPRWECRALYEAPPPPVAGDAANEAAAKKLYETWHSLPGYVLWQDGGNSLIQDEARKLSRIAAIAAGGGKI